MTAQALPLAVTRRVASLIFLLLAGIAPTLPSAMADPLEVPAFTGYSIPDPDGARMSRRSGVARWTPSSSALHWFGLFRNSGELRVQLVLQLPPGAETQLVLAAAGQSNAVSVLGTADGSPVTADFGTFQIAHPGYHALALSSPKPLGNAGVELRVLRLEGPASKEAHFNLQERRNAASVHLNYPVPPEVQVAAFYSEVTAVEDPTSTFYMACGWHRGYFGMQVNSPSERRIIFSVWDSGNEGIDRNKVAAENRVQLVAKGDGVYSGDFGNEGTGGHSHLKYPWRTGEPQRFLVTAQPTNETFTVFSGYYFHPDSKRWMLISSWKAPKEGGWLRRLHGFSENFWGSTGHLVRKARFGNQWIRTEAGEWRELTEATFSHDPTGRADRLDRFMGVEDGQFFLSHGGFVEGFTPFGERFNRPPRGTPPPEPQLPVPCP